MIDVYRNNEDCDERMATIAGAGLPDHVAPKDWTLMPGGTQQFLDDVAEDIAAHGFSYFRLC